MFEVIPEEKIFFGVDNLCNKARGWVVSEGEKAAGKSKAFFVDIKRGSKRYPEYMG